MREATCTLLTKGKSQRFAQAMRDSCLGESVGVGEPVGEGDEVVLME